MATTAKESSDQTPEDENLKLIQERVAKQAESSPEPQGEEIEMDEETKALIASANESSTELIPYRPGERNTSQEIEQEDVKLPRLKLAQAMSDVAQREENPIPAGQWYLTQGNVALGPSVQIVPLRMFKHRSLYRTGIGLLCRSMDMVNGVGTPGGKCEACALSKWRQTDEGNRVPPACNVNYNYPVIVLTEKDDPSLAMLTFSRTGSDAAKTLNGIKQVSLKSWEQKTHTLGRKLVKNTKGNFFVPEVTTSENTHPELLEIAKQAMGADDDDFDDDDDA